MNSLNNNTKASWRGIIAGIILMVVLGWLKLGITENLRVDHNPYPWEWGYPVFILFVTALVVFSFSYWKLIWKSELTAGNYRAPVYLVLILSSLIFPFLSNDVIIYLGHGYLHNQGVDVFSNTNILQHSIWAPYIDDWIDGPYVYGPFNLIPAKLANYIGGENIWLTFTIYKIIMLLAGICIVEILNKIVSQPKDLLIAILAPAFWLHGIGHLHNDLIVCLFVLVSVYFALNKQIIPSAIFMGIALACKISIVLYVPFIFVLYYYTSSSLATSKWLNITVSVFCMIVALVGCYTIYWTGPSSIEVPFKYLSNQQSTKSFAEILGEILNSLMSGINKANIESEVAMETIPLNDPKRYWLDVSKTIFNIIGFGLLLTTSLIFAIKTKLKFSKEQVVELFIKLNFIFFFYYLHIFQAWYLILLLPLVVITTNNRIKKYFMVLACYSGVHTIMIAIARPSILFYILPVLVIVNCLLFVWQFRKNFLTVEAT